MSKKKAPLPPPLLPCTGVDSHAHLTMSFDDLEGVLQRAKDAGVKEIGQVFLSPQEWREGKDLFKDYPNVFFLLGIHPTDAHKYSLDILEEIREIVSQDSRIRAIGEIGLDYYWKECPPEVQKQFFSVQLKLAKEVGLPVVIHCREAEADVLTILQQSNMQGNPLLWHCYGGDTSLATKLINAGWHVSIPGTVTFPKNTQLREVLPIIPSDKILIETDCPFLAPEPMRGKRNEPAYLAYTVQVVAEARGEKIEELWAKCGDNARRFFGLPTD